MTSCPYDLADHHHERERWITFDQPSLARAAHAYGCDVYNRFKYGDANDAIFKIFKIKPPPLEVIVKRRLGLLDEVARRADRGYRVFKNGFYNPYS